MTLTGAVRGCLVVAGLLAVVPASGSQQPLAAAAARIRDGASSERLSLERCVELALRNSHRRKAAASETEVAVARNGQARSGRFPEVSAGATFTRLDQDPNFVFPESAIAVPASAFQTPPMTVTLPANAFGPGVPPVNVPLTVPGSTIAIPAQVMQVPQQNVTLMDRNLFAGSLSAFYPLYTGGLVRARIAQAKAGVEVARHEQRRTDLEVVYDVTRAYYASVLARQLVTLGRDTLTRMEATLTLTESLYKTGSGRVKKTDFLRNKSMAESVRAMVADLEHQERTAKAGLEAAVEWDAPAGIEIADEELAFAPKDAKLAAALDEADSSSPEIARVRAALVAAKAGIDVARSGHLPKVGTFADIRLFGNSYDAGIMTARNKTAWSFGVGVEMPLFQGFRVANEVRAARAGLQKLEHQLASLREGVAFEVKQACSQLEKARAQLTATREAYHAATENRALNIRAYEDDLVETKDVIEAQLMEALMAAQHFRALYDNLEAQARLDLVAGQAGRPVPRTSAHD